MFVPIVSCEAPGTVYLVWFIGSRLLQLSTLVFGDKLESDHICSRTNENMKKRYFAVGKTIRSALVCVKLGFVRQRRPATTSSLLASVFLGS